MLHLADAVELHFLQSGDVQATAGGLATPTAQLAAARRQPDHHALQIRSLAASIQRVLSLSLSLPVCVPVVMLVMVMVTITGIVTVFAFAVVVIIMRLRSALVRVRAWTIALRAGTEETKHRPRA